MNSKCLFLYNGEEEKGRLSERINIAKNLLDVLDNETISLKIGLSVDEIEKLR